MTTAAALIADIGGTHARFALWPGSGRPTELRVMRCREHAGVAEAAEAYLAETAPAERPIRAAFAIASPVTGDRITMTNHPWRFSVRGLRRRLGLERLEVINDFTAVALSLPALSRRELSAVGAGTRVIAQAPRAVIGPGTGLGVSALVPAAGGWQALAGEGGHVSLAAENAREDAVIAALRRRFRHVSAERAISGPGLVNLYRALGEVDGAADTTGRPVAPDVITAAAMAKKDPRATEALDLFCGFLGTVAGDLALTLGARGGVYIAGGIVPRLGEAFCASPFRARFEAKGRFEAYLKPIPTLVITAELPALAGLTRLLGAD